MCVCSLYVALSHLTSSSFHSQELLVVTTAGKEGITNNVCACL